MDSFQFKRPEEMSRVSPMAQLSPLSECEEKCGQETWSCAFAPDESYFGWSCGNRTVVLVPWNPHKSCLLSQDNKDCYEDEIERAPITIDCGYTVLSLAFAFCGTIRNPSSSHSPWTHFHSKGHIILATGLSNSRIRIWDVPTGKLLMELMDHKDVVRDVSFAPDGSLRLVSASKDATLKVWDLHDDGNMFKTLVGHQKSVCACKWSPNAKQLASVGAGKMVLVWNMENYTLHRKLEGHLHDVVSCDFSVDGAILATASWDTRVLLWDPVTGKVLKSLHHLYPPPRPIFASGTNERWVRGVSFSADGSHLASIADDGFIRFWDLLDDNDPVEIGTVRDALCCTFSPSGHTLAVGTKSGSVKFFATPISAPPLQQLCRLAIRKLTDSQVVSLLELPWIVQRYLRYQDFN